MRRPGAQQVRRATAAAALGLLVGCGPPPVPTPEPVPEPIPEPGHVALPAGAQRASVVRHVDGDTVWLRGAGPGVLPDEPTKVRLLEIDTPEVHGAKECYGDEASRRLRQLLPTGAQLRVEPDRERTDRYGRTLLYAWTSSGTSVQEVLVREGYARVVLYAPNDRYIRPLRAVEREARAARRGMWGSCAA